MLTKRWFELLGFILSKINLLILVVAIFAIVSFFTFSLIDIVKVYEGRLLLDQLSSKAFSLVSSPSYCFSDSFDIPRSVIVGGDEFFYVIKISTQDLKVQDTDEQITVVIFSMIPRKEFINSINEGTTEPPSVAASAFRTNSIVKLYSRAYNGSDYAAVPLLEETGAEENFIIVDPSTKTPFNTIKFRKEVRLGEEFVYIYPCSSFGGNCESIKNEVACKALNDDPATCNKDDPGKEFAC